MKDWKDECKKLKHRNKGLFIVSLVGLIAMIAILLLVVSFYENQTEVFAKSYKKITQEEAQKEITVCQTNLNTCDLLYKKCAGDKNETETERFNRYY